MEVKVFPSSRQPVSFLDLPLELRRQIYQYCLVREDPIDIKPCLPRGTSLLLVSKNVGSEALEVLYGDNIFKIDFREYSGDSLQRHFTKANLQRIRKMQVVMIPQPSPYPCMLDPKLWVPALANLTRLFIVAQQPMHPPTFGHQIEDWVGWLRAVLQHIASQLPTSCIVEVDDDCKNETSALMKEYLPAGYRKVQTLAIDILLSVI